MSKIDKPLTDMQKEFVRLFVESEGELTQTECARRAGYEEKSAYQRAYELTNPKICPHVVNEISKYKTEYAEKFKVTHQNHITQLGKLRDYAIKKDMPGVAVNAEVWRGKAMGYYVEKHMNVNKNSIDDLTPEELQNKMDEMLDNHAAWVEDEKKEKN
jgi:phage terminase small subunit